MNTIQKNKKKGKIFVLWFQGEDNAPNLIKLCISSIRRNSNDHEVIVLDNNNLKEWVGPLSRTVEKKFKDNVFSLQLKADLIRLILLTKYNCLWIDATVFVSRPIPDCIFNQEFFTVIRKEAEKKDITGKISTFLLGRGNSIRAKKVFECSAKLMLAYISNEDDLINYLLIENIIDISIRNNDWLKNLINEYYHNKKDILGLVKRLDDVYDENTIQAIINDNIFNKLNFHQNYLLNNGSQTTVYGHLLKEFL